MAIKTCKACGKLFEGTGTASYCSGPHYAICEVCGKQFECDPRIHNRCCSAKCKAELRKQTIRKTERVCKLCGKVFTSNSNTQQYCNNTHYTKCVICGKKFAIPKGLEYDPPRACSTECSSKLRKQTCLDKYGVDVASKSPEVRQKLRESSKQSEDARQNTCLIRYGVKNASMAPSVRQKISDRIRSDECVAQTKQTMNARYGVDYAMQNHELYTKQINGMTAVYASDGTKLDSHYELCVYEYLKRNNIEFEYQVPISYTYNDATHVTYIDFKINGLYFEVKGAHLLQGCFDYSGVPISAKLDVYRTHDVILITDSMCKDMFEKSNGLKYPSKRENRLIGVDIDLFRNPEFPYRKDRPKCFYDVRVDGKASAHDAFFNENIRWNMIVNRIQYMGGFIDSNQILTALNVSRTCKQPSWFSQSFAEHIISTYCTSSTIVDPFAGWGARADAAKKLGKTYIGCDLNPELVKWHIDCGRTNISLGNAVDFRFSDTCSVFICPPYSDPITGRCFEDYNFEGFDESAKSMSQCDWLKLVMRNVPNANEYVMVCKIVDPGFEKYVVETKENKSHFGTNYEYVLRVPKSVSNIEVI